MKKIFTLLLIMVTMNIPAEASLPKTTPVLVFDFGGVLGGTDKQVINEEFQVCFGLSSEEADTLIAQYKAARADGQTSEQFWTSYSQKAHVELPPDWVEYLEEVRLTALTSNVEMMQLVKDLRKQGYRTAILANMSAHRATAIRKRGLLDLFDPVLLSSELGYKKPNEAIFRALLSRLNIEPSSCIFIDDKPRNVIAAKALGIDAIVFSSAQQLQQELTKRGVCLTAIAKGERRQK
jgi:epoxide hydrolase-like predicted phosphatase